MKNTKYFLVKVLVIPALVVLLITTGCGGDDGGNVNLDTPEISFSVSSLDFGGLDINEESGVLSVALTAVFLEDDVTISVSDGFAISEAEGGTFSSEDIVLGQTAFDGGSSVSIYIKTLANSTQGAFSGSLNANSSGAGDETISLSALIGLEINGTLFMSEYLEQYGAEWLTTLPLDSGILNWQENTSVVYDQENFGGGYPTTTVPNNEVNNVWYQPVPVNGKSVRSSMGISDNSNLSITGYPSVSGARNIVMDSYDNSELWNWINASTEACMEANSNTGNNTSIGRRFQADGYTGNENGEIFMSALVNVSTLGGLLFMNSTDLQGAGDLIALANATSGASNNNTIKVVVRTDEAGGMKFGLLKENEGNPEILSSESYSLSTTYLVVLKHTFVDGDQNDVSELYVFAEGDDIPFNIADVTPVATIDDSYAIEGVKAGVDPTDLTIVYLRERNQAVKAPEAELTGIRVGDSWRATLFAEHSSATVSNDITLHNRVLTNVGPDCTP